MILLRERYPSVCPSVRDVHCAKTVRAVVLKLGSYVGFWDSTFYIRNDVTSYFLSLRNWVEVSGEGVLKVLLCSNRFTDRRDVDSFGKFVSCALICLLDFITGFSCLALTIGSSCETLLNPSVCKRLHFPKTIIARAMKPVAQIIGLGPRILPACGMTSTASGFRLHAVTQYREAVRYVECICCQNSWCLTMKFVCRHRYSLLLFF